MHVALLNGHGDCANGIIIKPLKTKTVLIALDRGRFMLVQTCLHLRHQMAPTKNAELKNAVKFGDFCISKVK